MWSLLVVWVVWVALGACDDKSANGMIHIGRERYIQ